MKNLIVVNPKDVTFHPQNYNRHSDAQVEELARSLDMFDQFKNIVGWKDPGNDTLYVIAGEGLVRAALKRGMSEITVNDRSDLSEDRAMALMLADNLLPSDDFDPEKTAELVRIIDNVEEVPGVTPDWMMALAAKEEWPDGFQFDTELVSISELQNHPRNYTTHPDDQIEHLIESLKEHGLYRNIVIAKDNTILSGHGIVTAMRKMGLKYVYVRRLSVDPNEPRALKVLAGDNENQHLGDVDDRARSELLRDIKINDEKGLLGTGFDDAMLANLIYVTRDKNEIEDLDAAAEWVGLPEYENPPDAIKVVVSFRNEVDRLSFAHKLDLSITDKTKSVWWPDKKKEDLASLRFREGIAVDKILPRYPLYVPSKGRFKNPLTAKFLIEDGVPFYLVVEEQEYNDYAMSVGEEHLLVLPFSNQGLIAARNWIKEHSVMNGHARHWQLDDNIRCVKRRWKGKRIPCSSGMALAIVEDFIDRYDNVAIAGLNYEMFLPTGQSFPPFYRNARVYSCSLVLNSIPYRWRLRYNDDVDICLQALAGGLCTILVNAFEIFKVRTMVIPGGNTDDLYQGDGRLKMARSLQRMWPGVVEVKRRFKRPQHVIDWSKFDTPLIRRAGVNLDEMEQIDEYGMKLVQIKKIASKELRQFVSDNISSDLVESQ